jgi:hypothetical protein
LGRQPAECRGGPHNNKHICKLTEETAWMGLMHIPIFVHLLYRTVSQS